MSRHRSITRLLVTVTTMALTLGGLSSTAQGAIAGVCKTRIGFEADFGSGFHNNGSPDGIPGLGTITWDYTPVGGIVTVNARVQGTLYVDRFGDGAGHPGSARLKIFFQDGAGTNLSSQTIQFSGPGFNANDPQDQRPVDVNFTSPLLRKVKLVVGSAPSGGQIIDDDATTCFAVSLNAMDSINNGTADFGNQPHVDLPGLGQVISPAVMSLTLRTDGRIGGNASGMLFWDSTSAGCARLIIDFQNINGVNLSTRTIDECYRGATARLGSNQTVVNRSFNSASLFKIRLRVGTVSKGNFVGPVTTRTYSFGPAVGIVEGIPDSTFAAVGKDTTYGVQWTVPDPANWRSLDIMDVRLIDEEGDILQVRWDEATNTFSQINTATGRILKSGLPGSRVRFNSPEVTVFLKHSEVIGSGPAGPSVLLNLTLRFKQRAVGRTFTVEALARDDSGGVQGWDVAGTITVLPRARRRG